MFGVKSSKSYGNDANSQRFGWKGWFKKREEEKNKLRDMAAKMISNKLADNEIKFVQTLEAIDFRNSQIPKDILDTKSDANQPCGDLEYFAKSLRQSIKTSVSAINCNILDIDKELMAILLLFKQSVERGDVNAAYASRYALLTGFYDIRARVPQQQPNLIKPFIETYSTYLGKWITCIELAQLVDQDEKNAKVNKANYDKKVNDRKELIKDMLETLQNDPVKGPMIDELANSHESAKDRANWSDLKLEVFSELVDAELEKQVLKLTRYQYYSNKKECTVHLTEFEQMKSNLNSIPVVVNPNLMNQYKQAMEDMFAEYAKKEVEIEEALNTLEDYSARVDKLYESKGNKMLTELAQNQAKDLLDEAYKLQQERMARDSSGGKLEQIRKKYGILSKEEEEAHIKKLEEEKKIVEQKVTQVLEEDDTETIDN